MEYTINLRKVKKTYRMGEEKIYALKGIDLSIRKGEFFCLLGTSGSGKSTLLNLMAGLEKPTKGEIIINNHSVEKMNEKQLAMFRQENIGFVFQSYNLLPMLTALENVSLPLIFKGVSKKSRMKAATKMLQAVGLGERLNHKPTQLSGGQQQRVSIARAFIGKPSIVFADEPTGNLDTKTTLEIMELITNIARQNNQTLIIVTHDTEISHYADKVVYIKDGEIDRIEQNDTRGII